MVFYKVNEFRYKNKNIIDPNIYEGIAQTKIRKYKWTQPNKYNVFVCCLLFCKFFFYNLLGIRETSKNIFTLVKLVEIIIKLFFFSRSA